VPLPVEKLRLRVYLAIFVTVMIVGIAGFMVVEGMSLVDAAYFTIVTIATVGYGDIAPHTTLGKALDIFLIVAGVGTFVGLIANATEAYVVRHERQRQQQKLQMVIGLFFSELGTELLRACAVADPQRELIRQTLARLDDAKPDRDCRIVPGGHPIAVAADQVDFAALRDLLDARGQLLVRLLESPYLLEHERFTDLLIATLHLKEELLLRPGFSRLPLADCQHLAGDVNRVYGQLVRQWFDYLAHLRSEYPFLYSLALRTNPFDPNASVVVHD